MSRLDAESIVRNVSKRAPVLAFVSIKGGVGKTTLAIETAAALAKYYDKKVLLVDANFSAPNIGLYLDLTKRGGEGKEYITLHDALLGVGLHNAIYEAHGFDVVPASIDYAHKDYVDIFRLKKLLNKMRYRYDYIILDSAPNFNELKPVVAAADKIFIVTSPDEMTLTTSLQAAKVARQNKTPIHGIIVNRIRSPKHEMNVMQVEAHSGGIPVLARIQDHKKMASAAFSNEPITIHDEMNCVSREIRKFASALCGEPEDIDSFFQRLLPFKDFFDRFDKDKVNREMYREEFYRSG